MKASEVIKKLQELINEHGDLEITYNDYEYFFNASIENILFIKDGESESFEIQM